MSLVSSSLPALINGVSQQAETQRLESQCDLQENALASLVDGLRKRPARRHIAKLMGASASDAFIHTINRDTNERYVVVITNGDLKVYDIAGNQKTVTFPSGRAYLNYAGTRPFRALTVADFTFITNTEKKVQMVGDPLTSDPGSGVVLLEAQKAQALCFVKQINYSTKYYLYLDTASGAPWLNVWYDTGGGGTTESPSSVATGLANQLRPLLPAGWSVTVQRATIWIQGTYPFSLRVSDTRSNDHMIAIKSAVRHFADLPTVAPKDYFVKVSGDIEANQDDYYVKFRPLDGSSSFAEGDWQEVSGGSHDELDKTSMPHTLVRQADGTFVFGPRDWAKRGAGDDETSPKPSFCGQRIGDIFFFKNRLGLLSESSVVLSVAGEYFNFWRGSMLTTLDSDPIDVAVAHTRVSVLRHAVPFDEQLLLFSDQTQFSLKGGDLLTPKTVSIDIATEYECSLRSKPVGAGRNLFFAVPKGSYSGVREYFVDANTKAKDAADITAHVPHYIPAGIFKLASASNDNMLVALTDGDQRAAYIYQYYWNNNEKLQSAWGRWVFESDAKVLNADFIESKLFLVVQYPDGVFLDALDVESGFTDANADFEFLIDRKVTEAQCVVAYDVGTNRTTWTLPYALGAASPVVVVRPTGAPSAIPAGSVLPIVAQGPDSVSVQGDFRTTAVFLGTTYAMRWKPSTIWMKSSGRNGGSIAVGSGRLQLRKLEFLYNLSGYFRVLVTPLYRATSTHVFSSTTNGSQGGPLGAVSLRSGRFEVPVLAKNDEVEIEVINDSPLPSNLMSVEWTGFFTMRSRRM